MHIALIISLVVILLIVLFIGLYFAFSSPPKGTGGVMKDSCNNKCDIPRQYCKNGQCVDAVMPGKRCDGGAQCASGVCLKGICTTANGTWPYGGYCIPEMNNCTPGLVCKGSPAKCGV